MEKSVVVITGAGSGLGAALARKFSAQGMHVCLLGRSEDKLWDAAAQLPHETSIHAVDVASNAQVQRVMENIKKEIGPIDVLVNNAGTGAFELAERISEEDVNSMIDVNLKGTIFCTQAVLAGMREAGRGHIINIVSTAGKIGKVNESVYCASKFGVRGFTESLVLELKDTPIQVSSIYMGGMKTDFWTGILTDELMLKMMDPEDVAAVIMDSIQPRPYMSVEEIIIKNKK